MKTLFVTSDVTYLQGNGLRILTSLINAENTTIAGVIFLKVAKSMLIMSIIKLYVAGCFRIATQLLKNTISLPFDPREKLIRKKYIPSMYFESMNDPKTVDWVRQNGFELIINYRTRCIYKQEILSLPQLGCINIHHGMLPSNRGVFCDLYALSESSPAGFSIHKMNEKIDDGEILYTQEVNSGTARDYVNYLLESESVEATALNKILKYYAENNILPKGLENKCKEIIYTKNPDFLIIQSLKQKGMRL